MNRLFLLSFLVVSYLCFTPAMGQTPTSRGLNYWYEAKGLPLGGPLPYLENKVNMLSSQRATFVSADGPWASAAIANNFGGLPAVGFNADDAFYVHNVSPESATTTTYTSGTYVLGVKTPSTFKPFLPIYKFATDQNGVSIFLENNKLVFVTYGMVSSTLDFNRVDYTVITNKEYVITAQFDVNTQFMELFVNGASVARKSILFPSITLSIDHHGRIGGLAPGGTWRTSASTVITSAPPSPLIAYEGDMSTILLHNNTVLSTNERLVSESYVRSTSGVAGPPALNDCVGCIPGSQLKPIVRYETTTNANSFINDLSGYGWHGSAITSVMPTYSSNGVGGRPAVQFASGREIQIPSTMMLDKGNSNEERTYNLVVKPTDIVTRQFLYKQGDQTRGVNIYIDNNTLYFRFYVYTGTWGVTTLTYPLTNTDPLIITLVDRASNPYAAVNGNLVSGLSPSFLVRSVSGWSKGIACIGGNLGGTYDGTGVYNTESPFTGYVSEFAIYNKAFNTEEIAFLNNHQAAKYGITVNQNVDYYRWQEFFPGSVGGLNSAVSSSCSDELLFKTNTTLPSNTYIHIGNNRELTSGLLIGDHTFSSSTYTVPTNVARTKRTWRVDKSTTGSYPSFGGSQLLDFSMNVASFPIAPLAHQKPVFIIDADGDFSKDSKIYTLTKDVTNTYYVLPNVTVNAGDFITVGVINLYEYYATHPNNTQFIYRTTSGTTSNLINSNGIKIKALNGTTDYNYLGVAVNNTAGLSFSGSAPYALSCKWMITHYNAVGPLEFIFDPAAIGISAPLAPTEEYVLAYENNSLTYGVNTTNYIRFDLVAGVYKISTLTLPNIKYEFTVLKRTKTPITQVKTTLSILKEVNQEISSSLKNIIKLYGRDVYENGSQTQYNNENSQCPKSVKKAYLYLTFNTGDNYLFGNTAFTSQVQVNVKARKNAANTDFLDYGNFTLNIEPNKPEQLQVIDVTDYINQYPYEEFLVDVIAFTAPVNTTVNTALQFKAELIKEKKVMVLQTTDPIITSQSAVLSGSNKSCTFTWTNTFCDPYTYQFQLLRLFNGTTTTIPTLETSLVNGPLDWSKALTLETNKQTITLTLAEGTGYYAWRVRPVGNYYEGDVANNQNWGAWNTDAMALTAPLNFTASTDLLTLYKGAVLYYTQFDEDKNFIYNRVFTEDTKIHEGISYANGLQQINQTQAKVNSNGANGQVIISEPVYDFSGRASLQSMAAPDQTNNDLGYRPSALVKGSDKYNAFNFDTDTKVTTPDPIDNGLVNLYYSDLNTDPQIPDAENYPYSRTVYDNDGQNKMREQSGVGKMHSIGNKTVTTEYSTASDMELLRVFGEEAPKGNTVTKVKTTDQNNVSSITYTDLSGKVIATSLVKNDKTSNLEELPGAQTIHIVDLLNNNVPLGDNGVTATKKYTFSETTDVTVSLEVTPDLVNATCATICRTCSYVAIIKVVDDKTNLVVASENINIDGETLACGSGAKITKNIVIPNIPTGTYSITKTVMVDESKAAVFAQTVRDAADLALQDFIKTHVMDYVDAKDFQGMANHLKDLYSNQGTLPSGYTMTVNSITPPYVAGTPLQTGDEVKIGPSCCKVTVPIMLPELEPCEQYIVDLTLMSPSLARTKFGLTLATRYETACAPTNPFPMSHTELGSYTKQNLQDLFANMLAEPYYTCDEIWNAWRAQIALKEAKFVNPNDPTTGFSDLNTQAGTQINGDFSSVNVNTALAESSHPITVFLNEMKRKDHINGFIETQSDDLRTHAYKYFYYNRTTAPATGTTARLCEDQYCGNPALPADLCSVPTCVPTKISAVDGGYTLQYNYTSPSGTLVLNQANNQVIADFYFCINKSMPVVTNPTVVAQQVEDYYKNVLAKKTEMEATCGSACEDKRPDFISSLRKLYDSDNNGTMVNSLGQTITEDDICCTADQMVKYCKDQCYLTVVRERCLGTPNYVGEPVKLVSVGTAEEVKIMTSILGGSFQLQDGANGVCSTDFNSVEICKNIVGIYHLNEYLDRKDYSHITNANYDLNFSSTNFGVGRTGLSTQAMNSPQTYAVCTAEPGNRGITKAVTVSAWVRMNNTVTPGATNQKTIVKKMNATSGFHLYTNNGYAYFDVKNSGTIYSSGSSIYDLKTLSDGFTTSDPFIKDNAWHLVTGVCRGDQIEIWIDGQLQKSQVLTPGTITSLSTTATLGIGDATEAFEGQIDEVYIYSCALNKGDILDQFTNTQSTNLAFYTSPSSSTNCSNEVPNKLWDNFADNAGTSGFIGVFNGMTKVSDGRVWSYGYRMVSGVSYPYLDILDENGLHVAVPLSGLPGGSFTTMTQASDGKYLLGGIYKSAGQFDSFFMVKLDLAGQIIWFNYGLIASPTYTYPGGSTVSNVKPLSGRVFEKNGKIYFVSTLETEVDVIELTSTGSVVSNTPYLVMTNPNFPAYFNGSNSKNNKYLFDGNYIYAASKWLVSKLDLVNHTVIWQRNTLQDGNVISISAIEFADNQQSILIAGPTDNYSNNYHKIGLKKINTSNASLGSYVWQTTWEAPDFVELGPDAFAYDIEMNVTALSGDRIAVMGFYYSNTSDYRGFTIVVSSSGTITPINYPNPATTNLGNRVGDYKPLALLEVSDGYLFYGVKGINDPSNAVRNKFLVKYDQSFQIQWQRLSPQASTLTYPYGTSTVTVNTGVYLSVFNNQTILIGNTNYWGDGAPDPDFTYNTPNMNNKSWWYLNLGFTNSCPAKPICIKWVPPAEVVNPVEPPPVLLTPKDLLKDHITNVVFSQIGQCYASSMAEASNQYLAQCKENVIENCTVSYDITVGNFTLYYYDRRGNLVKTVPPAGVVFIPVDPNNIEAARQIATTHKLETKYKYNSLGHLVEQTIPDGGTIVFRYNKLGMLRFSQDAEQAKPSVYKKYSYTKYDALGRPIEVGQSVLQSGQTINSIFPDAQGIHTSFELTSFPTTNTSQETFTVYSDAATHVNYLGSAQQYLRNRVSYSFTKGMDGNKSVSYFSYDPHGNVKWIVQELPGMGKSTIGYEYDLISNKVLKVKLNENRSDQFFHRYLYDSDNRITCAQTSSNGHQWDTDVKYAYYKHGPLRRTELGEDHVQGLDYTYTIQGWLKALNAPTLNPVNDPGQDGVGASVFQKDEYGFVLGYYGAQTGFNGDFKRGSSVINAPAAGTLTSSAIASDKPLYNGNITSWTTRINAELPGYQVTGNTYNYDFLNRIRGSKFYTQTSGNPFVLPPNNDYSTTYTYDGNGNLETLTRKGPAGANLDLDNLVYNYDYVSGYKLNNRLRSVTDIEGAPHTGAGDIGTQLTNNYMYDDIGNLTGDQSENLAITWNMYGKISEVKQKTPTLSGPGKKTELRFIYDVMGNRIEKEENTEPYTSGLVAQRLPENLITTYYVRDASGNVMGIYQRTNAVLVGQPNYYTATYTKKEIPLYGSSRLGIQDEREAPVVVATKIFHKDDYFKVTFEFSQVDQKTELNNWLSSSSATDNLAGSNISSVSLHSINFNASTPASQAITNIQNFAGVEGKDVSVAENDNGQVLFYTTTLKKYWGKTNVLLLFDANGNIMRNSGGIYADANARSVIVQSPVSDQQYLLFTRNATDKKLYYHIIDLNLQGNGATPAIKQGDVKTKNIAVDATNTYGTHLLAIEDRSKRKAYIYTSRYVAPADPVTAIGTTDLTLFEVSNNGTSLVKAPSSLCAQISSWDDLAQSELQVSADGKKLTLINHQQNLGWYAAQKMEAIVFNMGSNFRLASNLIVDATIVPVGISFPHQSADFSADSRFLYYSQQRLTAKPDLNTMGRFDLRNNVQNANLYTAAYPQIQRSKYGKVYAYQNTNRWNAFTETATGVSTTSPTDDLTFAYLAGGNKINNYLPIQNRIVYRISEVNPLLFSRRVGKKNYELSDHLGNVTVVVSDELESDGSYANKAHVESYNNYYAFGMVMPGRTSGNATYRYGFNGKEKDVEISSGSYDFGARMYDTRLTRWFTVDPLFYKYPTHSPYLYGAACPIYLKDPDGRDLVTATGQLIPVTFKDGVLDWDVSLLSEKDKKIFENTTLPILQSLTKTDLGQKRLAVLMGARAYNIMSAEESPDGNNAEISSANYYKQDKYGKNILNSENKKQTIPVYHIIMYPNNFNPEASKNRTLAEWTTAVLGIELGHIRSDGSTDKDWERMSEPEKREVYEPLINNFVRESIKMRQELGLEVDASVFYIYEDFNNNYIKNETNKVVLDSDLKERYESIKK